MISNVICLKCFSEDFKTGLQCVWAFQLTFVLSADLAQVFSLYFDKVPAEIEKNISQDGDGSLLAGRLLGPI